MNIIQLENKIRDLRSRNLSHKELLNLLIDVSDTQTSDEKKIMSILAIGRVLGEIANGVHYFNPICTILVRNDFGYLCTLSIYNIDLHTNKQNCIIHAKTEDMKFDSIKNETDFMSKFTIMMRKTKSLIASAAT